MSKSKISTTKSNPTTPAVVSRAQSAVAKNNAGRVPPRSYVGRLQRAAAKSLGKSGGK